MVLEKVIPERVAYFENKFVLIIIILSQNTSQVWEFLPPSLVLLLVLLITVVLIVCSAMYIQLC